MFRDRYLDQVRLLIRCLPAVSAEQCFALKGGTAINLFLRDMPRISVDIDLAYLPLKSRDESLTEISAALSSIAATIRRNIEGSKIYETLSGAYTTKLLIRTNDATVKIEPNLIVRGSVYPAKPLELAPLTQNMFQAFATMTSLTASELYGSKLCAALDRQHPRDLFDIKLMLETIGLNNEVRIAFLVYLASHPRPMSELLDPRPFDIRSVYHDQFAGMTSIPVSLDDLLKVQHDLPGRIRHALTQDEKAFLLAVKRGEPEWDRIGIPHLQNLPALQWKIMNVRQMDTGKREAAYEKLKRALDA